MMADAKRPACDFGMIVVYDVKRFGRIDNDDAGYYRPFLRTHGVQVRVLPTIVGGPVGAATETVAVRFLAVRRGRPPGSRRESGRGK